MTAALPAFAIEAVFYLGSVFEQTRLAFARIGNFRTQAVMLWVSALLPYLVFALISGTFNRNAFYLLAVLCGVFAFWHALLPRRLAYDIGFLVIAAAPLVLRTFRRIYWPPDAHTHIEVLGHLMWIRLGIASLLVLRDWDPGQFGFWPRKSEWRTGLTWYAIVLVPIFALAVGIHDARFQPVHSVWWRESLFVIGTFFGVLWVVALGEELFFRGVVERSLLPVDPSPNLAIIVSASLFGAAHLWFHPFPDWRTACVATLLGVACGMAYARSGSVRAPMVTHAFVVTTWRVFFR